MHIITRRRIIEAEQTHPDCASALRGWFQIMSNATFTNFAELKSAFNSVDKVGSVYVFNVGGNKLRLVAAIHFNTGKVFIRAIMTHTEYDKDKWKE
jgi:mRNA interferase HigB